MGVAISMNPVTGDPEPVYREVTGADPTSLSEWCGQNRVSSSASDSIRAALFDGERLLRDIAEVAITLEAGEVSVGPPAKADRSAQACVRAAVSLTAEARAGLSRSEAVAMVEACDVEQLLHSSFDVASDDWGDIVAAGLGASPGVGVGAVYFSADAAFEAFVRGETVILVCQETSPADIHGMEIASGILTTKGGVASHAAVVARGWGIPAVVGVANVELAEKSFRVGAVEIGQGEHISIDGSTGQVRLGERSVSEGEPPPELFTILEWADEIRAGRSAVRANADNGTDAIKAREFGAQGIGLCRTEHMFLGHRLPVIQRMIVATTEQEKQVALEELGQLQRTDFVEVLAAMDGLPVTIRLLDPPLHEFLPPLAEIVKAEIEPPADANVKRLIASAAAWQEVNPMLGTRGVRLAVLMPELYKMQTNALAQAVLERSEAGGDPQVEIMVPLVVDRTEVELARSWIETELNSVLGHTDLRSPIQIGAMIETPRAALRAGEIAEASDFLSFGTNDLTQLTFGFSRDDIEHRLMASYLDQGLLEANPFHSLDKLGVGALIEAAVTACRGAADAGGRQLKLGACGEHSGEPESISFLLGAGIDYVSCSPFRVPVARLASAKYYLANDS